MVYRVDKFVVPESAREEFLTKIRETHELLRRQPGFVRDAILEQIAGPGRFNIVTVAEWEDQSAIDAGPRGRQASPCRAWIQPAGNDEAAGHRSGHRGLQARLTRRAGAQPWCASGAKYGKCQMDYWRVVGPSTRAGPLSLKLQGNRRTANVDDSCGLFGTTLSQRRSDFLVRPRRGQTDQQRLGRLTTSSMPPMSRSNTFPSPRRTVSAWANRHASFRHPAESVTSCFCSIRPPCGSFPPRECPRCAT